MRHYDSRDLELALTCAGVLVLVVYVVVRFEG
jgi:hypothetical protein